MNLTLHLIKKDVAQFRWSLVFWALSFTYLFVQAKSGAVGAQNLRDYLMIAAIMMLLVSGFAIIAGIIQNDHPTAADVHWRTLPISARRLLGSKLLLLGLIFVVMPILAGWLRSLFVPKDGFNYVSEYGLLFLLLANTVLSLAAAAACTRNMVQCLLLWFGLIFFTGTLSDFLNRFSPVLSRQAMTRVGVDKMITILTLSLIIGVAVLLNQYVRRRVGVSYMLLLAGSVSLATIGAFWGYFYFYRG